MTESAVVLQRNLTRKEQENGAIKYSKSKLNEEYFFTKETYFKGPSVTLNAMAYDDYIGATVGGSLAEAHFGPFGVRAGIKLGVAIKNATPQVDLGPVTLPCCIQ